MNIFVLHAFNITRETSYEKPVESILRNQKNCLNFNFYAVIELLTYYHFCWSFFLDFLLAIF